MREVENKEMCWLQKGNTFNLGNLSSAIDELPIGIYNLELNMFGFYLERVSDEFILPDKIYGFENNFISRIIKTWNHVNNKNLGILMNGIKGSGKTVTGKILCNELKLPVILISQKWDKNSPNDFLNSIAQNVAIYIDEYEKIYDKSGDLLSLMDGTIQSDYRKVFILTTNDLNINTNLLDRPSRIRYHKTFGTLSEAVIRSILDDILINKKLLEESVTLLKKIQNLTVDICLSIIEEINIHNVVDKDFCDFFNASEITEYAFDIDVKDEGETTFKECYQEVSPIGFNSYWQQPFKSRVVGQIWQFGYATMFDDENHLAFKVINVISANEIQVMVMKESDDDDDNERWVETGEIRTYRVTKFIRNNKSFSGLTNTHFVF